MGMTNELIVRGEPEMINMLIEYIDGYDPEKWEYEPNDSRPVMRLQDRAGLSAQEKSCRFSWQGDGKTPPAVLILRKFRLGCLIVSDLHASGPITSNFRVVSSRPDIRWTASS